MLLAHYKAPGVSAAAAAATAASNAAAAAAGLLPAADAGAGGFYNGAGPGPGAKSGLLAVKLKRHNVGDEMLSQQKLDLYLSNCQLLSMRPQCICNNMACTRSRQCDLHAPCLAGFGGATNGFGHAHHYENGGFRGGPDRTQRFVASGGGQRFPTPAAAESAG